MLLTQKCLEGGDGAEEDVPKEGCMVLVVKGMVLVVKALARVWLSHL